MINYKMSRDINGNKTVKISIQGVRGFSIQTNGNLPNTHRNNTPDRSEINGFIKEHGTPHQKNILAYR